jgi:hypothetical protein
MWGGVVDRDQDVDVMWDGMVDWDGVVDREHMMCSVQASPQEENLQTLLPLN